MFVLFGPVLVSCWLDAPPLTIITHGDWNVSSSRRRERCLYYLDPGFGESLAWAFMLKEENVGNFGTNLCSDPKTIRLSAEPWPES
jgi:hypothetical protein